MEFVQSIRIFNEQTSMSIYDFWHSPKAGVFANVFSKLSIGKQQKYFIRIKRRCYENTVTKKHHNKKDQY
jgi:hypothetical protein